MHDQDATDFEHALNTPLTRVRLSLQMLERGGGLNEKQRERLEQALISLDQVQDVCAKILARVQPDPVRVEDDEVAT